VDVFQNVGLAVDHHPLKIYADFESLCKTAGARWRPEQFVDWGGDWAEVNLAFRISVSIARRLHFR
jgi:hypothetical protein